MSIHGGTLHQQNYSVDRSLFSLRSRPSSFTPEGVCSEAQVYLATLLFIRLSIPSLWVITLYFDEDLAFTKAKAL